MVLENKVPVVPTNGVVTPLGYGGQDKSTQRTEAAVREGYIIIATREISNRLETDGHVCTMRNEKRTINKFLHFCG